MTCTCSTASFQAENLFSAIEIFMLSVAVQAPAASWPQQARSQLQFCARPWLQVVPVARVVGWTSQSSAGLRFGAPGERCTLESCLGLAVPFSLFCMICHVRGTVVSNFNL